MVGYSEGFLQDGLGRRAALGMMGELPRGEVFMCSVIGVASGSLPSPHLHEIIAEDAGVESEVQRCSLCEGPYRAYADSKAIGMGESYSLSDF